MPKRNELKAAKQIGGTSGNTSGTSGKTCGIGNNTITKEKLTNSMGVESGKEDKPEVNDLCMANMWEEVDNAAKAKGKVRRKQLKIAKKAAAAPTIGGQLANHLRSSNGFRLTSNRSTKRTGKSKKVLNIAVAEAFRTHNEFNQQANSKNKSLWAETAAACIIFCSLFIFSFLLHLSFPKRKALT